METTDNRDTLSHNIPPIIESDDREYRDSGVLSTVGHRRAPWHPLSIIFPIAASRSLWQRLATG